MTKDHEITVLKRSLSNANNVILEKDKQIIDLEKRLEVTQRELLVQRDSNDTQRFIFKSTLDRLNDQLGRQREDVIQLRKRLNECP